MTKAEELSNLKSCLNRARLDEVIFVLIGRDAAAPDTIRFWTQKRISLGKNNVNDPQIKEALDCANKIESKLSE